MPAAFTGIGIAIEQVLFYLVACIFIIKTEFND